MKRIAAVLGFTLTLVAPFTLLAAAADTKTATPAPKPAATPVKAAETDADLGHHGQFNARVEFLTGYGMLFRYDQSPRCAPYNYEKSAPDQQKFCGLARAPALGVAIGFSLLDFFEPFAFARFGLSNEAGETNQGKLLQVGAGARLYTMSDSRFKIFFSPWLGLDLTDGPVEARNGAAPRGSPGKDDDQANVPPTAYRTDILAHLDIGPQYDIAKGVGVYVSGGLTFQMLRYLGATADLAIGVQMRAP